MSLTPHQVALVQSTFRTVQPMTTTAAELFYKRLFEIEPAAAALFKGDMSRQGRKFMEVLAAAVGSLHSMSTLVPFVQRLGLRHAACGVEPEHYDSVQPCLSGCLPMMLPRLSGRCCHPVADADAARLVAEFSFIIDGQKPSAPLIC